MNTGSLAPAGYTSMNPPPPMFPASGQATARAKAVATAASTELPPAWRMERPTSAAAGETQTTAPWVQVTVEEIGRSAGGAGSAVAFGMKNAISRIRRSRVIVAFRLLPLSSWGEGWGEGALWGGLCPGPSFLRGQGG